MSDMYDPKTHDYQGTSSIGTHRNCVLCGSSEEMHLSDYENNKRLKAEISRLKFNNEILLKKLDTDLSYLTNQSLIVKLNELKEIVKKQREAMLAYPHDLACETKSDFECNCTKLELYEVLRLTDGKGEDSGQP